MTSAPTARDQASDDEETKVRWDLESIRRCLTPGASFIPTVELTPQRTAPLVCLGEQFLVQLQASQTKDMAVPRSEQLIKHNKTAVIDAYFFEVQKMLPQESNAWYIIPQEIKSVTLTYYPEGPFFELTMMVSELLASLHNQSEQSLEDCITDVECNLVGYVKSMNKLCFKSRSRIYQFIFILGAIKRNFEYLSKSFIFFRDTTREKLFVTQELTSIFSEYIPQITQIYSNAIDVLARFEQFSDVKDLCHQLLDLLRYTDTKSDETLKMSEQYVHGVVAVLEEKNLKTNMQMFSVRLSEAENSLCNAFGFLLYKKPSLGDVIRRICVNYLKSQYSRFRTCVEPGNDVAVFDEYCKIMGKNRFEGTSLILIALAEIYERDIVIYKNQLQTPSFTIRAPTAVGTPVKQCSLRLKLDENSGIFAPVITSDFYSKNTFLEPSYVGQYEKNKIDEQNLEAFRVELANAKRNVVNVYIQKYELKFQTKVSTAIIEIVRSYYLSKI